MRKRIKKLEHLIDSHLVTVKLSSISLNVYISEIRNERQLNFDVKIETVKELKKAYLLTNTDASASEFVNINFVKHHKLLTMSLKNSIKLRLTNNNLAFNITRMTLMKFQLAKHVIELWCLVTSLRKFDLILDMSWLEQHDLHVSFKKRSLTFNFDYCLKHCSHNYKFITIYSREIKKSLEFKSSINQVDITEITVTAFVKMTAKEKNSVMMMWSEHFEQLNRLEKKDRYLLISNLIADIAVISADDYDKFFNKIAKKSVTKKKLQVRVFECFHRYINRWNSIDVNKLSSHREWDYLIELKFEFISFVKKIYELSREQTLVVKKYIDDMLEKDFIRSSKFEYAASILIVKKLEKELRVCVDYRALNALIIKNRNASSLIRDTLARLCKIKIYSKFDIIATFNEIRMREEDEKKIAFLIRYDLFEYVVMSFDLCNASDTFQVFINNTLREYLNDFISVFLDDILMYSESKEKHIEHVTKVLVKLKKVNLFLDIDKCEFFVISIKYLDLIIITEKVRMNFKKIEIIVNWKFLRCIKDVQAFLSFANFYRKFILDYSRIALSLSKLIRISEKEFAFLWNSNESEEATFNALKKTFTTASILQHFDSDLKTWIETDASNFVVVAILSQRDVDDQLHSIVFMSKKMSSVECNYEIYDKKLLTIVRAFEEWRFECANTLVEDSVKILIDHKNLKHFMTFKHLNRRQIKWVEFLVEFNFKIAYRSNVQDIKLDNLTRRSQDLLSNINDERHKYNHRTLLKAQHLDFGVRKAIEVAFALMNGSKKIVTTLAVMLYELSEENLYADEKSMIESSAENALENDSKSEKSMKESLSDRLTDHSDIMVRIVAIYSDDDILQRIIQVKREKLRRVLADIVKSEVCLKLRDCEIKNELLWIKKRLYVSDNEVIQSAILKRIHNSSFEDHVDRATIYDRLSRNYYWSRMTDTMFRYVKACIHCRRIKVYRENKQDLLKPLSISERYFHDIFVDFIISLSICLRHGRKFQHIMMMIDRLFKKKKFIFLDFLKIEIVMQAFLKYVWREKEYSISIISNRKSQFISHFWRRLCERIETNFKLSIAWHSETDDQTKRANQNLKQYLRAYVNFNQDDWVNHLSIAEFEINFVKSSSSGVELFLTTKEYLSRSGLELLTSIMSNSTQRKKMKDVDDFIAHNEIIRQYLRDELKWSQTKMKKQINKNRLSASKLKINDMMMLNSRYLKTIRSNRDLDYRNLDSFKIIRVINNNVYELKLSKFMKDVFSVFHLWLLHLKNSNLMFEQENHESDFVIIDAQDALYDIEEILNFKIDKRMNDSATTQKECLCYRVRWVKWKRNNQRSKWYRYTNVQASDLIANYHYKYSKRARSHVSFERSKDWTSLRWAKRKRYHNKNSANIESRSHSDEYRLKHQFLSLSEVNDWNESAQEWLISRSVSTSQRIDSWWSQKHQIDTFLTCYFYR